jgi:uncharacterized membrane protein
MSKKTPKNKPSGRQNTRTSGHSASRPSQKLSAPPAHNRPTSATRHPRLLALNAGTTRCLIVFLALLILVLAAGLRLHQLEVQSFWNDEGNSVVQAARTLPEIAEHAARDIHPPGYYWLLHLWRLLAGDSEFSLRALSAFAGVLTVACVYALGRRLFSPLAGLAAALFVTLNTFQVYYSQEARMYALLALWAAAGLWALVRLLSAESHVPRSWLRTALLLGLINAAGLYTQYAYPFVMLAQGGTAALWLAARWRSSAAGSPLALNTRHPALGLLAAFILANLIALALFLPLLPTALHQVTSWPNTGEPAPASEALYTIAGWLTYGLTFEASAPQTLAYVPIFLAVGLVPFGLRRPHWPRLLFPVVILAATVGLFLALGLYRPANLKFLLPAQIAVALALGRALEMMWTAASAGPRPSALLRAVIAASFGLLLLDIGRGLPLLYDDPAFQRADYRAIAAAVAAEARAADAIILNAPNQEEVFRYYYRGEAAIYPLPRGLGGDDAAAADETRRIISQHPRLFAVFWGEAERDPNRIVETLLDAEAFEAGENVWYGDVRLARYAAPAALPPATRSGAVFGETITLVSYRISAAQPGAVLQVQLDWQTEAALDSRYKVFVQLLDASGALVLQRDAEPGGGSRPTDSWQPGETITDRHGLFLPPDLPPGDYRLIVGLYDLHDPAARLPVAGGDYLTLSEINIA